MSKKYFQNLPIYATVAVGVWILVRFFLPMLSPFLLAAVLALTAEPLVSALHKKIKLPRSVAAAIGVTVALAIAVLLTVFLCALLIRQMGLLAGVLPDLEDTAMTGLDALENWMLGMAQKAPGGIQSVLTHGVRNMFSNSSALLDRLIERLLSMASAVLKGLPDSALGFGTWILASFMISARFPKIRTWLSSHIPTVWKEHYVLQFRRVKNSFGAWLVAQLKLTGTTFAVLTAGFFLLHIAHPLLWAAVTCVVDILPILGTGTVLIPWSVVCFLQGDTLRAVGLLGIYGTVSLLRSVLEPRLVGKQLGLDPLTTLLAIYAGYRFWGLLGMIFAPVLAALTLQILTVPEKKL